MGVAHCKHIAGTDNATHHISTIPLRGHIAKHCAHIEVIFDGKSQSRIVQSVAIITIKTMVFFIERVANLLKNDVGVAIYTWMLTGGDHAVEHRTDIGHIKVAAEHQRTRAPVVATEHGVGIHQATFSCSGIA